MARYKRASPRPFERNPGLYQRTSDTWTTRYYQRKSDKIFDLLGLNTAPDDYHKKAGGSPYLTNVRYMGEREGDQRAQVMSRKGAQFIATGGELELPREMTEASAYLNLYEGKVIQWELQHNRRLTGIYLHVFNKDQASGFIRITVRNIDTETELSSGIIDLAKTNTREYERHQVRFMKTVRESRVLVRIEILDDVADEEDRSETRSKRSVRILSTPHGNHSTATHTLPNTNDAFGDEVSTAVKRYADYYNRVGGLKPFQVDDVIELLDLGGQNGTFAFGTYQNDDQQTVRQESKADANRRALELGLPTTAARDLYGQNELLDDGSNQVSYYDSTLANATIRDRVYGAPKQIAYEFSEIVKADRKAGIPSLYDAKKGYDEQVSALYDEAKGLKGKAATAVYDQISALQERYMEEVFDPRIRPLIEKYGAEVIRNSTVMKEISGYVEVPGDFTPFASKKKQPYLTDDVVAYLKDRYGVGNINERNLRNDDQSAEYIKQINADLSSGNVASARFKATRLKGQVDSGRIYVDSATMDDIAAMIKARNKR